MADKGAIDRLTGNSTIYSFRLFVVVVILTAAFSFAGGMFYLSMGWRAELEANATKIEGKAEAEVIRMIGKAKAESAKALRSE